MDRKPAEIFHPGVHLRDELDERGWESITLQELSGIPSEIISMIRLQKTDITPEIAERLSKALGTSPEYWLNLQKAWDERSK